MSSEFIQSGEKKKMTTLVNVAPHEVRSRRSSFQLQFGIRKYNPLFIKSDKSFIKVDRSTSRTKLANLAGTEENTVKTMNGPDCDSGNQQTSKESQE